VVSGTSPLGETPWPRQSSISLVSGANIVFLAIFKSLAGMESQPVAQSFLRFIIKDSTSDSSGARRSRECVVGAKSREEVQISPVDFQP
jgi:hypothetical protein